MEFLTVRGGPQTAITACIEASSNTPRVNCCRKIEEHKHLIQHVVNV